MIHGDVLTNCRVNPSKERMANQSTRMLKVAMGPDLLARKGAMVAAEGHMDYAHHGAGAGRHLKGMLTGESVALMLCSGEGNLFLGQGGADILCFHIENDAITVNAANIVAFDATLTWDVKRVQGAGMAAGGLSNVEIAGTGWVALSSVGPPIVLDAAEAPTFVDTDAIVAWSTALTVSVKRSVTMKALIGRGSGEAFQLAFQGLGLVIVQPAEPAIVV